MAKKKGETRETEMLAFAQQQAENTTSWIDLHNALFGIGGKYQQLFPTEHERAQFSKTDEYKQIRKLLDALPMSSSSAEGNPEFGGAVAGASGRVLVRLPRSIHAALLLEAEAEGVSLNQLILSKIALQLRAVAS